MINDRLNALRAKMKENGIDVYYFNTSDYHSSEYVPEYFKTIRYFSDFTGSLATLLVDEKSASIFVDGRYHLQAENECGPHGIEVVKLGMRGALDPIEYIKKNYEGKTVGFDGKRTTIAFSKDLLTTGTKLVSRDIYSEIIEDRAPLSDSTLFELDETYTGLSRKEKLERVKYCLNGRTHVINNLESVAYLLNLRGNDIKYTPVFMSFMVFYQNDAYLFVNLERLSPLTLDNLYADGVIIRPYDSYYEFLKTISRQTVLLDEFKVNYQTKLNLEGRNNRIIHMRSIVEDMKSIKNETEVANSFMAHIYDGVAMVRFLKWISEYKDKKELTEYDVAIKLNRFRLEYKAFDLSFAPIVSYNENAAIMHYSPKEGKSKQLDNCGILLVDSGGQYYEGTTDITRTFALGPVEDRIKKSFCLVLSSMFNMSEQKVMKGITGKQLDMFARQYIWNEALDFRHGTGHGVGQVLAVHEAPPSVRYQKTAAGNEEVPIRVGNIFSDEPGLYYNGEYGIRCENMIVCRKDESNEYGDFLAFDTLTVVPFDLNMIEKKYLDAKTVDRLNAYHKRVFRTLRPYLSVEEATFLKKITKAI